jgi:hypothetical protein
VSTLTDRDFKEDFKALWEKLTNISSENSINLQWWERVQTKIQRDDYLALDKVGKKQS